MPFVYWKLLWSQWISLKEKYDEIIRCLCSDRFCSTSNKTENEKKKLENVTRCALQLHWKMNDAQTMRCTCLWSWFRSEEKKNVISPVNGQSYKRPLDWFIWWYSVAFFGLPKSKESEKMMKMPTSVVWWQQRYYNHNMIISIIIVFVNHVAWKLQILSMDHFHCVLLTRSGSVMYVCVCVFLLVSRGERTPLDPSLDAQLHTNLQNLRFKYAFRT